MPLTDAQRNELRAQLLAAISVPLNCTDCLGAARMAVTRAMHMLAPVVSVDRPPENAVPIPSDAPAT